VERLSAGRASEELLRTDTKFAETSTARPVMKDFIPTTFKTSDGVKLSYLRAENGLPVILLQAILGSGACFKSQAQILGEQYDVIVLDQLSHGESEKVPFRLKLARLSKDLFKSVPAMICFTGLASGHASARIR
jgi:pimeloyl-ACP methyl ester carboxylesterase